MRSLLPLFPKPSHYCGHEEGSIHKDPKHVNLRVALAFPDTYEVGMSYLGQKILYNIINDRPNWQAERVMAPEAEAARIMREHGVPLATLESNTPLAQMDALGFSVTHELCYTDLLHMLDLAGIPLRSEDRGDKLTDWPLVMAGGGAMLGAEPISPFLDLVALGDGEELLPEILELLQDAKEAGWSKKHFLEEARHIRGVYVPSFFVEAPDGSLKPLYENYRPTRRIVADLNKAEYPTRQVAPVGAIHNRISLEIARGCPRGCRFCHAGMVYRPLRERESAKLAQILDSCLNETGFEEVSFLALSAGDHGALEQIYNDAYERCAREQITLSLPSLRVGSVSERVMDQMASLRRTGVTLAPEAGSQRLRDVINKGITEEELISHAQKLILKGWRQIKLYFMVGLPTETDADLDAIYQLCCRASDAMQKKGMRLQVTASISPFVPKPFTPFQWEEQISLPEIQRRINYLRELFRGKKFLKLRWHEPESSHLEGLLSRAGRKMADVVEKAYKKGAIFCGWVENFDFEPWREALEECHIDMDELIRAKDPARALPWDHLEAGISREFLWRERQKAYEAKRTPPCGPGSCSMCGACEKGSTPSLLGDYGADKVALRQYESCLPADQPVEMAPPHAVSKVSPPKINPVLGQKNCHCRIWHRKMGQSAFLSHLELQAFLERLLRRAKVPVAFSQGFHPMPLLSFGKALPVGIASEAEWFSLGLHEFVPAGSLRAMLDDLLDDDLAIMRVEYLDKKVKTEQPVAEAFCLNFKNESSFRKAWDAVSEFLRLHCHVIKRMSKSGEKEENIRPYISGYLPGPGNGMLIKTDWTYGYVSPQLLFGSVLSPIMDRESFLRDCQIVKFRQSFANGREYGLNDFGQRLN